MENENRQNAPARQERRPAPRRKKKKSRMPQTYREFERLMSWVLGVDVMLFLIYLMAAARDVAWLKGTLAGLVIAVSVVGVGFLFLNLELTRPRSRWITTAFCALVLCLLVSLVVRYPRPAPVAEDVNADTQAVQVDLGADENAAAG